jgi:hypothetical protein
MEFVIVELDDGAEVGGGASSSSVRQRSGEHYVMFSCVFRYF